MLEAADITIILLSWAVLSLGSFVALIELAKADWSPDSTWEGIAVVLMIALASPWVALLKASSDDD